jgi:hydroxyquinol 1,2-dioxygenase
MAHVTQENLTETVINSFDTSADLRFKFLISSLITHIHQFARETSLTHDEWQRGLEFLTRASQFTDIHRNEFVLTSDVLGLSSLIDLMDSSPGVTEGSVLGPFHTQMSPMESVGVDLTRDNDGDPVFLQGCVRDLDGKPIPRATLDFWQTAANGLYPAQDADQRPDNLRCRMLTGDDGRYSMRVIRPSPYTVPYDGPVGELLRAGGRHAWRPAHFHFIVSAPGFRSVVTELFNADDKYIEHDAAFGVRASLLVKFEPKDSPEATVSPGSPASSYVVNFDFRLRPDGGPGHGL